MINTIIEYLRSKATGHIFAIAAVIVVLAAGRSWLVEHDARILAQATVTQSQGRVVDLQKQLQDVMQAGQVQIAKLQKERQAVKTPAQAIAALPEVSTVPLNAAPLPDAPGSVKVDALPLFQTLNECKQCSVERDTVTAQLAIEKKVEAEKDVQIAALKKKPGFWKRTEKAALCGAIGAVPFFTLTKPGAGIAVAGAGAIACSML